MNCYGFVYIWMDVKKKMFYIGSHAGSLDDGYVGSNIRLKRAYKKRPKDFKRRILAFCHEQSKEKLHKEEQKWLMMIKVEELNVKYYNLKRVAAGGKTMEFYTDEQKMQYREKLRKSAGKDELHHNARKVVCFGKLYNTLKEARRVLGFNPQRRLSGRKYPDFYYFNEGPLTEEEIQKQKEHEIKVRLNGIKARSKGISEMSPEKRKEKGLKASKTRKEKGFDFYKDVYKKLAEKLRARPGRKVSIDGVIYEKARIAGEELGFQTEAVRTRIKSQSFPTWFYLDDPPV